MKRRELLIGMAALALGTRSAAAPVARAWTVPDGAHVELWPADFGLDLAGALDAVALWHIRPGARVTIRLADGVHAQRGMVDLRHPDGIRLSIVGNIGNPGRCRLVWQGGGGLYCGAGAAIGRIDGVRLAWRACSS